MAASPGARAQPAPGSGRGLCLEQRAGGDVDDQDAWRAAVGEARQAFYTTHFGPLPDQAVAIERLTGVWPGCLVQVQADRLDGLTVSASYGLTDPGLPPSVQGGGQPARERGG